VVDTPAQQRCEDRSDAADDSSATTAASLAVILTHTLSLPRSYVSHCGAIPVWFSSDEPSKPSGFLDEADDKEQNASTDEGRDDGTDQSAHIDTEHSEEPAADDSADDTDDDIADEAETTALHDHTGQPTCNRSERKKDYDARQIHVSPISARVFDRRKNQRRRFSHLSTGPQGPIQLTVGSSGHGSTNGAAFIYESAACPEATQCFGPRETNARRTIPGMYLEAAQAAVTYPQNHPHRHTFRSFGVGENQRSRRCLGCGRRYPEIDARTTAATAANDLQRFELTNVANHTGPYRTEQGLDEVVLVNRERSGVAGSVDHEGCTSKTMQGFIAADARRQYNRGQQSGGG